MSLHAPTRTKRTARVGPGTAGVAMTPEEFDALTPEDCIRGYRYELIRGVLVVTPIPGGGEVDPNEELGYWLRGYRDHHPQGSALDLTLPERYVMGTPNRRRADRVVWVGLGRYPEEERDVPAIVIEFVSARKRDWIRDYEQKRDEYLKAGVHEYWVIDRFRRLLTVYRNRPEGVQTVTVAESETYRTDLLPGFELPLGPLWTLADRWSKRRREQRDPDAHST